MLPITKKEQLVLLPNKLEHIINKELETCNGSKPYLRVDNFITENVDKILTDIEKLLDDSPKKLRKRTFNVSVELIQNINLHTNVVPKNINYEKFGFFILCKINNFAIRLITGNFVDKFTKQELNKYLSYLKGLTEEDIKEFYFKIFNLSHNFKGGAGLGFIEIAKKTQNNFDFKFINYNLNLYLFIFNATVTIEKTQIYGQ